MSASYAAPLVPEAPANVARAASAAGFGGLQHVFMLKRTHWLLLVFVLLMSLATVIVGVGLWLLWLMFFRKPDFNKKQAAKRIYLYSYGFILAERPDDLRVYRWDDIDTVYQKIVSRSYNGVYTGTYHMYDITRRDGEAVKVTQLWDGGAELGRHINQQVSAAQLPGMLAAIQRGQGVQFQGLTLTAGGISTGRAAAPWAMVSSIGLSNGYLRVRARDRKMPLALREAAKIPNLPLFLELAKRLHAAGQGAR